MCPFAAREVLGYLNEVAGDHPGARPVHARGIFLKGVFNASDEAAQLSMAPHFCQPETSVIARFSSGNGDPNVLDTDPAANPKGLAVRFFLHGHGYPPHTDIATVSIPVFPAKDEKTAREFFKVFAKGGIEDYLPSHPEAQAFIDAPKPFPATLASELYWSINAFKLINEDGKETFVRYQFVPKVGVVHLSDEQAKVMSPGYLFDAVPGLLSVGPLEFDLVVQLAEEGDVTDDSSVLWPQERKMVTLGTLKLQTVVEDGRDIVFEPMPRNIKGIEASGDPLIRLRSEAYYLSGRERHAEVPGEKTSGGGGEAGELQG